MAVLYVEDLEKSRDEWLTLYRILAIVSVFNLGGNMSKDMEGNIENPIEQPGMWEILVPTMRQDGRPIRTRFHRVWDDKVRSISNGLTVLPPTIGQWISPDETLYKERMIPVRIMCNKEQIEEIIDMTLKYYEQEAVLAYKISSECILRHA